MCNLNRYCSISIDVKLLENILEFLHLRKSWLQLGIKDDGIEDDGVIV